MSAFMLRESDFQVIRSILTHLRVGPAQMPLSLALRMADLKPSDLRFQARAALIADAIVLDWWNANRNAVAGRYENAKGRGMVDDRLPDLTGKAEPLAMSHAEQVRLVRSLRYQCHESVSAEQVEEHEAILVELDRAVELIESVGVGRLQSVSAPTLAWHSPGGES